MCGWLRPCTLGDSSLLVQRRVTRRKDPRSLRRAHTARSPARLASAGRSPNSPGAHNAPRARSGVSRIPPAWLGARLAPTGMGANHLRPSFGGDRGGTNLSCWGSRCSPQPTELERRGVVCRVHLKALDTHLSLPCSAFINFSTTSDSHPKPLIVKTSAPDELSIKDMSYVTDSVVRHMPFR